MPFPSGEAVMVARRLGYALSRKIATSLGGRNTAPFERITRRIDSEGGDTPEGRGTSRAEKKLNVGEKTKKRLQSDKGVPMIARTNSAGRK